MKLGRKPAVHNRRTMRSAIITARTLDALGAAPDASNDYLSAVKAEWGVFANDRLGDCVCADTAHALMLRTANVGTMVQPLDDDVIALYETVGGYVPGDSSTDNGCDETAMCDYLESAGFLGHKSDATATVDPSNLAHLRWCIQLFAACRIGVNFPNSAMDQFNAGKPWDYDPSADNTIEGGHDVPLVDYRNGTFACITWGKPQIVTPAWLAQFCDEAHSELFFDWIRAQGQAPSGFDLDQLASDMAQLKAA